MGNAATRAKQKYNDKSYDRVFIVVPKGDKERMQEHCKQFGYESLNKFVGAAIEDKINSDIAAADGKK